MESNFKCEHCSNKNWFIPDKISWNPEIYAYHCFYCGWVGYIQ